MAEQQKKAGNKGQPKIHRRKNEEVPKDFMCTVTSCSKAYGSYAALYTHMKNKHADVKPPTMPNVTKNKNGQPGRPKIKKSEEVEDPELDDK